MQQAINRLSPLIEEVPLVDGKSAFVQPRTLFYTLDGKKRRWDAVENHGSVGVVIFHSGMQAFLLVRQFRPAVYATAAREAAKLGHAVTLSDGFTIELCAGIVDKQKSLEEITSEEIQEETGYKVRPEDITYIATSVASAGTSGSKHHMYFAEVDDSMRVDAGGGLQDHGEMIEVLSLPLEQTEALILDPSINKSPGLQFGLLWAYHRIMQGKVGKGSNGKNASLMNGELELRSVLPA